MRCACAGCVHAVVVGCCAAFAITGTLEPVRLLSGLQKLDLFHNQITGMHIAHEFLAGAVGCGGFGAGGGGVGGVAFVGS